MSTNNWLENFREKFHQYTMDDPRDVWIEETSGEFEDFIALVEKDTQERVIREILELAKKAYCRDPEESGLEECDIEDYAKEKGLTLESK